SALFAATGDPESGHPGHLPDFQGFQPRSVVQFPRAPCIAREQERQRRLLSLLRPAEIVLSGVWTCWPPKPGMQRSTITANRRAIATTSDSGIVRGVSHFSMGLRLHPFLKICRNEYRNLTV